MPIGSRRLMATATPKKLLYFYKVQQLEIQAFFGILPGMLV
jgi:hypothetical protein